MTRLLAASFFVAAAYNWPLPFTDRVGTALLGLSCLALSVGAGGGRPRALLSRPAPEPAPAPDLEALSDLGPMVARMQDYVRAGGSASSSSGEG